MNSMDTFNPDVVCRVRDKRVGGIITFIKSVCSRLVSMQKVSERRSMVSVHLSEKGAGKIWKKGTYQPKRT